MCGLVDCVNTDISRLIMFFQWKLMCKASRLPNILPISPNLDMKTHISLMRNET
jgi:hypothetical protein